VVRGRDALGVVLLKEQKGTPLVATEKVAAVIGLLALAGAAYAEQPATWTNIPKNPSFGSGACPSRGRDAGVH
jgi:hypothetical protein